MDRKKRYKKRSAASKHRYVKREFTTEKAVHYILYPVVFSTINGSNDFYFHILQLCWNDKNIQKDRRYRQMVCGLRLKEAVDTENLAISAESGWFTSSRQNDLANIGKIAGYFIRRFAYSVGESLYDEVDFDEHSPIIDEKFNKFVDSLKLNKAVIPVVIKLDISQQSSFDTKRFITVSEDLVKELADGDEIAASSRSKLIKIKTHFHDWAWKLLNMRTLEERIRGLNDRTLFEEQVSELSEVSSESSTGSEIENTEIVQRTASMRMKYPNKMYSSEIYEKNQIRSIVDFLCSSKVAQNQKKKVLEIEMVSVACSPMLKN